MFLIPKKEHSSVIETELLRIIKNIQPYPSNKTFLQILKSVFLQQQVVRP